MLTPRQFQYLKVVTGESHFVENVEAFGVGRRLENLVGAIDAGDGNLCFADTEGVSFQAGFDVWNEKIAGKVTPERLRERDVWGAMCDGRIGIIDDEVVLGCEARIKES
jgi:hypothetical protein